MILHYPILSSTQDTAKELEARGAPHGTAVLADAQTRGRGQYDRSFHSPPGGMYLSVIVREGLSPETAPLLTPLCAAAVIRTLPPEITCMTLIKWPNDILMDGRKLCGLIGDGVSEGSTMRALILGIGINVNTTEFPDGLYATSLRLASGRSWDIATLAGAVHTQIMALASDAEHGRLDGWLDEFRACAAGEIGL
jgi:BirA family biotin operon repressor/biotin-[acetyl-CoA-carboxylase] ligase